MSGSRSTGATGQPLGTRLQEARIERGLSVDDVSRRILLSTSQVRGLERGDSGAFYNAGFYHQALTKYAALLGVPADVLPAPPPPAAQAPLRPPRPDAPAADRAEDTDQERRRLSLMLVGAAVVVVAAVAGGGYLWFRGAPEPTAGTADVVASEPPVLPAAQIAPAIAPLPAVAPSAEPAIDVLTDDGPTPPGAVGTLRVTTPTWVYARYADGTVVERTLDAGTVYTIEAEPTYLAVGSPDVVLTVGGRAVDVTPWLTDGQVRIGSRVLAAPPFARAASASAQPVPGPPVRTP